MKIELSSEEASITVGVFIAHLQRVPWFSKEHEQIMDILNKIFTEDKKQVNKILSENVVR